MRLLPFAALFIALITPSFLLAADAFDGTPKDFSGGYLIYSGDLGDWAAPSAKDAKLYLEIKGDAAKKIFAAMSKTSGADAACAEAGTQLRRAGDLQCTDERGQYICYLGYDIKKGKSATALIC